MSIKEIEKKYKSEKEILNLIKSLKGSEIQKIKNLSEIISKEEEDRSEKIEKKSAILLSAALISCGILAGSLKFIFDMLGPLYSEGNQFVKILILAVFVLYLLWLFFMFMAIIKLVSVFKNKSTIQYTSYDIIKSLEEKEDLLKAYISLLLFGALKKYKTTNEKGTFFNESFEFILVSVIIILILLSILILLGSLSVLSLR